MAGNLSWLRRFAIRFLQRHLSQHSTIGKSRKGGRSNEFLAEVLAARGTQCAPALPSEPVLGNST